MGYLKGCVTPLGGERDTQWEPKFYSNIHMYKMLSGVNSKYTDKSNYCFNSKDILQN